MGNFFYRFAFLLICAVMSLSTSAARLEATAEIDSVNLLMGTTTRLSVRVEKPADGKKIRFPVLEQGKDRQFIGLLNDSIELSNPKIDTVLINNKNFINYDFTLQAFDSGRYVLPPFELIIDKDTAYSNRLDLNVIPVKVKADDQLDPMSDIAQPFEITMADGANKEKSFWAKYWWIFLLLAIFIGVIIFGYIRYRKTGSILPPKKVLSPFEVAMISMRRLKKKQLWEKGKDKEYYTSLIDILRGYLHSQYGINAMNMTSRQIMKALKKDEILRANRELIRPVFQISDFVKFAKERPEAEKNIEAFDSVEQFLTRTKPVEVTPEQEGGAR